MARARRRLDLLRHRFWRALPRSFVELGVAIGFTWGVITVGMAAAFVVECVLSLAHHV